MSIPRIWAACTSTKYHKEMHKITDNRQKVKSTMPNIIQVSDWMRMRIFAYIKHNNNKNSYTINTIKRRTHKSLCMQNNIYNRIIYMFKSIKCVYLIVSQLFFVLTYILTVSCLHALLLHKIEGRYTNFMTFLLLFLCARYFLYSSLSSEMYVKRIFMAVKFN